MRVIITSVISMVLLAVSELTAAPSVPIKLSRNKVVVEVKINDLLVPEILLDTGFSYDGVIIYNPDWRDSLDLSGAVQASLGGAGSGNPSTALVSDSVQIGLGERALTPASLIVLQNDIYKGFPTNGLIGYSIFGHFVTEIDYDDLTMQLSDPETFEPDSTWTALPLYFKDNMVPWTDIMVEVKGGDPLLLSAYIDYASEHALEILEKPNMTFQTPVVTDSVYLGTGLSGDVFGKQAVIHSVKLGGLVMKDVKTSFVDAAVRSKQPNADAVIGSGALRQFNLIFDYFHKVLYLKPNSAFGQTYD